MNDATGVMYCSNTAMFSVSPSSAI